jgi:CTP synthase
LFDTEDTVEHLNGVHGILVPGGFGERGAEGKIRAVQFARENNVPYLGICFGMQMAVIEAARNLAGLSGAGSTEFGPCDDPVVGLMTEWQRGESTELREAGDNMGGTMRLGAYPAALGERTHIAEIYGLNEIAERHRHRYEVNINYRDILEKAGMTFSGTSPDGLLPETIELEDHPWFIGVQFHPELKSKPFDPHPLFKSFVAAALAQSRLV